MERLLGPWDGARLLRLGLAVAFLWAAIAEGEAMAWAAAVFFGVQALFNVGCCGAACATPPANRNKAGAADDVNYEEVR
ncbi:MAG: hypothetical protein KBH07_09565 [Flavobacteriales bacterium]|nr:hypothetical protein [Flavobacteriales bacterium]MBP9081027.1 hypothetical protein [Flavobacteriales bacterium]